jgi:hypothetical protein
MHNERTSQTLGHAGWTATKSYAILVDAARDLVLRGEMKVWRKLD